MKHEHKHILNVIAKILLIIGGLNLGMMAAFCMNPVESAFGEKIAYYIFVLVGISALYKAIRWAVCCSHKHKHK